MCQRRSHCLTYLTFFLFPPPPTARWSTLFRLPSAYNGLEPFISEQIMTLHHTKHHQGYVTALNTPEANYLKATTPKERIALQAAVRFNGKSLITQIRPLSHARHPEILLLFIILVIAIVITIDCAALTSSFRPHQPFPLLDKLGAFCSREQGSRWRAQARLVEDSRLWLA